MDSDEESPCFNMPNNSSSEDEDTEDGKESDSQTSETCEGQTDNQMEVSEDIRALLDEDQELVVDTVQVSSCNSYFMCNRDNPMLKSLFATDPTTQAYKNNLETGESVEKEKGEEEMTGRELVEVGMSSEWGQQLA